MTRDDGLPTMNDLTKNEMTKDKTTGLSTSTPWQTKAKAEVKEGP